jgi:hypothetical protein
VQVIAASLRPSPIEENLSEGQLHRALVFDDSPGKSDSSNGSVAASTITFHDSSNVIESSPSTEDDSSSAWSIQVHASSEQGDDEELGEEEYCTEEEKYYTEEEDGWEEEEGSDDGCFDDLCEEMSKMTVFDDEEEEKAGLPQFEGKHTRFIYNSDGEIERAEVAASAEAKAELDTNQGRHLRFQDEE